MAKKKKIKVAKKKKVATKKATKIPTDFSTWWEQVGEKKVSKMEKQYLRENPDYDPDEELGGDSSYVHAMYHQGEAHNMTYEIAEEAFNKALNGEEWEMSQSSSLYCELDGVIIEAHEAGLLAKKAKK